MTLRLHTRHAASNVLDNPGLGVAALVGLTISPVAVVEEEEERERFKEI